MELAYAVLIVINIYLIVYYRLVLHYGEAAVEPDRKAGIGVLMSLPRRAALKAAELKYWQRYWTAWAVLGVLLLTGVAWRGPHIAAQLGLLR